ncbi:MAG: hypothetical protein IPK04_07430 [Bdellovibrionales bacterium]|nr:hypothetical protein [Bdellovibrionales bacterium]
MKMLKFTSQLLPNWFSELDQVPDGRIQSLCNLSLFRKTALRLNTPRLSVIESFSWKYIVTAKPDRNKEAFLHRYEWTKNLPLKQYSKTENQILTNLVICHELSPEGEILYQSSWVKNLPVDKWNVTWLVSQPDPALGLKTGISTNKLRPIQTPILIKLDPEKLMTSQNDTFSFRKEKTIRSHSESLN